MSRHPKVFKTFFMKRNPLDGMTVQIPERVHSTSKPLLDRALHALFNYEKDTKVSETGVYEGDTEYPQPEALELKISQTLGLNLEKLSPELAAKYQENRKFWETYFNTSNKEWGGKPEETVPRVLWVRKHSYYLVYKAEVIIEAPIEEVARLMMDNDYMARIDPGKISTTVVREESPQCKILHMVNKGSALPSQRDNLLYRFESFEDRDTFIALYFAADDVDYPSPKDVVRTDLKIMGLELKREAKNRTKMVSSVMLNPKVTLPMHILRGKIKEISLFVTTIKKEIEKVASLAI